MERSLNAFSCSAPWGAHPTHTSCPPAFSLGVPSLQQAGRQEGDRSQPHVLEAVPIWADLPAPSPLSLSCAALLAQ